ncbi:MAG: phosphate uptake regulator PhoU [Candidatus Bathyarchaeia archaeon]
MEKRRVQLVGRSTLTISLPTIWARKTGIKKGDFVTILTERDGSLRIVHRPEETETDGKTITINADQCQERGLISRLIITGYVRGYDRIVITSSKRIGNESLKAIRDAEFMLLGLSIIEETPTSMTLQCSIDSSSHPIDTVIRRLYLLFSTMYDEDVQALIESRTDLAEEARRREHQANRVYALILRLLNQAQSDSSTALKIGISDATNILNIVIIANALERMADWADKIAENIILLNNLGVELSDNIGARIVRYSSNVKDIFEKIMKSLFTKSIEQANAAINHFEDGVETETNKIIDQLRIENIYHGFREIERIVGALHRIGENAVTIALTIINAISTEKDRSDSSRIPALKYLF